MRAEVIQGDCLEVMRGMDANSVDLICADPPYYKVKGEDWDNQWKSPEAFLGWLGEVADEWARVLKPNGSLYCFASPQMATRVDVMLAARFNIVNNIRWQKPPFSTKAEMFRKEDLRSFFPASETIIFAEHYGADNIAKGEAGYGAKCDVLRGFVFEPLRAYLAGEWERAGLTKRDADEATGTQMAGHWFTRIQWALPTAKHYATLQERANATGGEYLRREYEYLRREYEELRREYEELRRPFSVTADVPYTDVWTFPTVQSYKGKHVCEKPQALLRHIITASSREGSVVLDTFAGSGSTGEAAIALGRKPILIERSPEWCERIRERLSPDLFGVAA